jgi:hypothetical protein
MVMNKISDQLVKKCGGFSFIHSECCQNWGPTFALLIKHF